jgi:hypothetical protein
LATAFALLNPPSADATDSDLKHSYAFRLPASNGYRLIAIADSQSADGKGELLLIVGRHDASALYLAPATVTATRIEADLGVLGAVSLDIVPSGRTRSLASCGEGEPRTTSFEPQSFRGSFAFHGEEGFTDAVSQAPREYSRLLSRLACGTSIGNGEISGGGLPGARLRLRGRHGDAHLRLQANKNSRTARAWFEIALDEKRDGITISRARTLWASAGAFAYDPDLRTATIEPPAPFSGRAVFRRGAVRDWSGDLAVDLPGRSDVSLAGAGVTATLAPACRQERGGGRGCRRPSAHAP